MQQSLPLEKRLAEPFCLKQQTIICTAYSEAKQRKEENEMFYAADYPSPLGVLTLVSDGKNLVELLFEEERYPSTIKDEAEEAGSLPIFVAVAKWLDRYFAGEKPDISELALAPSGSAFRQAVWKILCGIPYGTVTTYGEIAGKIAKMQGKKTMSAQAVGGAVGHNPISIIIPCHRVVGTDGSLTGFGGGIDRKVKLLTHERVDMTKLFVPKKETAL